MIYKEVSEYDPTTMQFTGRVIGGNTHHIELNRTPGMSIMVGMFLPDTHDIVDGKAVAKVQPNKPFWMK
jgi:hypothetical protein